jgi:AraC family transcriptional regulator, glycine betaine-responsive activator
LFPEGNQVLNEVQSPVVLGFLVFPGFPMACLTSMIEPLRAANEIAGARAFVWRILSEDGGRVEASAGVGFDPDLPLGGAEGLDHLFLLSGPMAHFRNAPEGEGRLRRLARHGTAIGAVSGGVFPLARTGLLDGHACSVHWCYEAAFAAEFPQLDMKGDVIVSDRGRHTASGAAAAFDLMLGFIEERLGASVATEVACWFQHPLVRGQGVRQKVPTLTRDSTGDMLPEGVARAVDIFADHIDDPVEIDAVARATGMSARQLERQFKLATGQSPSRYYRMMRMQAARQLVLYSKDSLTRIALAVGYDTTATLTRHYREAFGIAPLEERRRINAFRVAGNRPLPST